MALKGPSADGHDGLPNETSVQQKVDAISNLLRTNQTTARDKISEQLLIQYFYEGLLPTDRSMIDAASGGAFVDKTPEATRNLIANMEANSQQIGTRLELPSKNVNEALADSRKDEQIKDLYETFRRCENCAQLRGNINFKGCEKVRVGENVSAIIQRKLLANCKDPGMFTIPCTLGTTRFEKAMIDLGSSINVMPYSIYASLKLGPLNKTGVVIQLADKSNAYPKGLVDDVLLKVNDFIFLIDFYVLDMENDDTNALILLGRPFLKTSKTKIDVHSGTLTNEFDSEIVKFNIYYVMKYPCDDNLVYSIDVIDSFAQEVFELDGKDELEVSISQHLEKENEG
ncbi:uncharacterized protein [Aristolochia californica]|uniref:uncharacterized protein n=1 Tax=Aristolochia californica TaxID=171875 RepID=UPI0035DF8E77